MFEKRSFRENQNLYIHKICFRNSNRLSDKIEVHARQLEMTIWRMRIVRWITKTTHTHLE